MLIPHKIIITVCHSYFSCISRLFYDFYFLVANTEKAEQEQRWETMRLRGDADGGREGEGKMETKRFLSIFPQE